MKILVVSHTYIVDLNCEKLKILADLDPEIEVRVIVPKRWRPGGVQNKIVETQPRTEGNFRVVPVSNFSQNNQALLTFGTEIISLIKEFSPNIIQVEQGAKSLGYTQLITLNKLLGKKAKNLFFTWWNLPYKTKFPISLIEAYNLRHTDGLIAGNQDAEDILRDHGYTGEAKVMPQLGVDEILFSPSSQMELRNKLGIKLNDFVIGFAGRFVQEKGILTLIKAVSGIQNIDWKLLLIGRGELKETILTETKAIGIEDKLIIVENIPHEQMPDYINLMNTLVLPSETTNQIRTLTAVGWKEQFGHVLIEAMACKVPVIGSNSGEIPNVIGDAGLIFPEGDFMALRQCLIKLIEQTELTEKIAEKGYERLMTQYTNKALAQSLLDFYEQLLNA